MTYLMSIFLGLVQGVAEFLPISSSGHLTLLQHFFGMEEVDNLYNILLHFATLIAVFIAYRKDIAEMIVEFFRGLAALFTRRGARVGGRPPLARRLVMLIVVAQLLVAYLIELFGMFGVEKAAWDWRKAVGMALAIVGIVVFKWESR